MWHGSHDPLYYRFGAHCRRRRERKAYIGMDLIVGSHAGIDQWTELFAERLGDKIVVVLFAAGRIGQLRNQLLMASPRRAYRPWRGKGIVKRIGGMKCAVVRATAYRAILRLAQRLLQQLSSTVDQLSGRGAQDATASKTTSNATFLLMPALSSSLANSTFMSNAFSAPTGTASE